MNPPIKRSFRLSSWLSWSCASGLIALASCGGKADISAEATGGASVAAGAAGLSALGGAAVMATGGVSGAAGTGANAGGADDALPPSCTKLPATCGPTGDVNCCASRVVPGGTYDRSANGQHFPTTVSDFVLDTYEITVGRFRRFVAAYAQDMIPAGAGKNPNNPADPGWDPTWNANLDADAAALKAALKCDDSRTWTDSPGSASAENLPIECLSWFEAEAFCIWDNGRLPTDAEWTYVASGGAEQRTYPWGDVAPDCAHANYMGAAAGMDYCVQPGLGSPNPVGSESPQGDGKWGQADLGGNVSEWTQDWTRLYSTPCNDCAALTPGSTLRRLLKGGSFAETAFSMRGSFRVSAPPAVAVNLYGARCARNAP